MKKKIYTFCLSVILISAIGTNANAATFIVHVQSGHFAPTDFTINTGDSVIWMWDNNAGNHTTTSINIPAGAAGWNELINQNAPVYVYVPVVAGSYNYNCTFHASSGMVGHFTVNATTGISVASQVATLKLNVTSPANGQLHVQYEIPENTKLSLQLYDVIGNKVRPAYSNSLVAGAYNLAVDIDGLRNGIYLLVLETSYNRISRRVIIE